MDYGLANQVQRVCIGRGGEVVDSHHPGADRIIHGQGMEAVGVARVGEADSLDFHEKETEGVGEVGDNVIVGWGIFVVL